MQNKVRFYDIAVIGGGASGMTAAITAKKSDPEKTVAVLEAGARVGKKLLTTGNGQCNLSNSGVLDNRYHGSSDFALNILKDGQKRVNKLFSELCVELTYDRNGRVYPYSRQASAVLDALRFEMERLEVNVFCDTAVKSIKPQKDGFLITAENNSFRAKKVILSTGGKASQPVSETGYLLAKGLGHKITPLSPSIVQIMTDTSKIKPLKGIKIDANVKLMRGDRQISEATDELLFTEYGISGPAAMHISRNAKENDTVSIDLCPDKEYAELLEILFSRKKGCFERSGAEFLNGFLNKRLGQTVMTNTVGKKAVKELSDKDIKTLAREIKGFKIAVTSKRGFSSAQVTAGGVDTRDVTETLESKIIKGLFFTGELLDVDGDCGGFNLLFAWVTGLTAGQNAAK